MIQWEIVKAQPLGEVLLSGKFWYADSQTGELAQCYGAFQIIDHLRSSFRILLRIIPSETSDSYIDATVDSVQEDRILMKWIMYSKGSTPEAENWQVSYAGELLFFLNSETENSIDGRLRTTHQHQEGNWIKKTNQWAYVRLISQNPIKAFTGRIFKVSLRTSKTVYSSSDTIRVVLENNSDLPIFIRGCSPLEIGTEEYGVWTYSPMYWCFWEGFAKKVPPRSTYEESYPAGHYAGVHKFTVTVYFDCKEGKPVSDAECKKQTQIFSPEFTVSDNKNMSCESDIFCEVHE